MNKSQTIKRGTRNARKKNFKQTVKKIITFPWRVIKAIWRFICRVCSAIWNWLKSIDIIGMINLTLLVVIIVLFSSLIAEFVCCNRCPKMTSKNSANVTTVMNKSNAKDQRGVVQRSSKTTLPVKVNANTNIKQKIKTVGVEKPQVVKEVSVSANELPQQVLSGDVIVDTYPSSPVLSNGVKIDGNLFIQNMRKYTIPCDTKINGHLVIRNVDKLYFCGKFTVKGNIYVNRQSSFGAIPSDAKINGQIIL